MQNSSICIFKNGKKSIFAPEKSLKLPKMQFSDFFLVQKIDFLPFLKMQIKLFCTFEIAFFPILEHCEVWRTTADRKKYV